jgi:putative transposase
VPRKPRVDLPDSIHHVMARANSDELLYRETSDRWRFTQLLRAAVRDHDWRCHAYCLMSTHFHLLVYTVDATLSVGVARLLGDYARWFNLKYERRGHLFASRFASRHVTDDAQLLATHRYIALNPVQGELCADPAEWRWGSYRALAGLERAPDFVAVNTVHRLLGGVAAYRALMVPDPERGQAPEVRAASAS